MKIKTSELTGAALDWAVAKCGFVEGTARSLIAADVKPYSTSWQEGGPIIERERISISDGREFPLWTAWLARGHRYMGKTPLIAAMRCFVASRLVDEVDIPDELMV